jgi:hypothetical protein
LAETWQLLRAFSVPTTLGTDPGPDGEVD